MREEEYADICKQRSMILPALPYMTMPTYHTVLNAEMPDCWWSKATAGYCFDRDRAKLIADRDRREGKEHDS
jgi:hypothetical protein